MKKFHLNKGRKFKGFRRLKKIINLKVRIKKLKKFHLNKGGKLKGFRCLKIIINLKDNL